jgi:hypothetical protein
MAENVKYFIGDAEMDGFNLFKLAKGFGWKGPDKTLVDQFGTNIEAFDSITQASVDYLRTRDVRIKIVIKGDSGVSVLQDETKLLEAPKDFNDTSVITIIKDDGVFTVDTALLSEECWDIQIWGLPGCKGCGYKGKFECWGEDIMETKKNVLGNVPPLAIRIADRPKREGI